MANTKSATSKSIAAKKREDKIDRLEKQIKEQQNQIVELMQALELSMSAKNNTHVEDSDISADEEILVISLIPNKLNNVTGISAVSTIKSTLFFFIPLFQITNGVF